MTPEEKQAIAEEKRYRAFLEEWNDRPVKAEMKPPEFRGWGRVTVRNLTESDCLGMRRTIQELEKKISDLEDELWHTQHARARWKEMCIRFEALCRENGIDPLDDKGDPKPCA